jgi:hypothetical protein
MKIAYTTNILIYQIIWLSIFIINNETSKGKNQVQPHHIKRTPSY